MLNRKRIVKIEEIIITEKQQEMIKKYREIHPYFARSTEYVNYLRKDVKVEGTCCMCDQIANKLITYRVYGIFLKERYCNSCFSNKDSLEDMKEHVVIKR